jgi:branched-chain amino acid aminotransferase
MADIIPFDQRDGSLWFDGKLVPWKGAKIHVLTHGLHYASSVFEGERLYSGRIYKLEEHTTRLFKSAEILDMKIPFTQDQINRATLEAVAAQNFTDAYIRPVVYRGSEMMSVAAPKSKIHVAIAVWQWPSYFDPTEKLKGKHEAESRGFGDAMMLDYRGLVAEATGANIFFAKEGKLHTPIADCFLNGITRRSVIELARARQIPVFERHIEPSELETFEECFLTGSAAEVTPVSEIGPHRFKPGAMSETIMKAYAADVRKPVSEVTLKKAS